MKPPPKPLKLGCAGHDTPGAAAMTATGDGAVGASAHGVRGHTTVTG